MTLLFPAWADSTEPSMFAAFRALPRRPALSRGRNVWRARRAREFARPGAIPPDPSARVVPARHTRCRAPLHACCAVRSRGQSGRRRLLRPGELRPAEPSARIRPAMRAAYLQLYLRNLLMASLFLGTLLARRAARDVSDSIQRQCPRLASGLSPVLREFFP